MVIKSTSGFLLRRRRGRNGHGFVPLGASIQEFPDSWSLARDSAHNLGHPALLRMWDKRLRGCRVMGYRIAKTQEIGKV
ncbi:hypothetical protein CWN52_09130 [Klebsiella michiganensis]|nr:hypothetical protein CWN52_09130 [Klebsiella michiganensis]PLP26794.1 hypothetical protein CWM92_17650 [Klebsiella michiganensis]